MPGPPPTLIHQFSLDDGTGATYVASGEVEGRLLNQFAMSEYNGDLRVATTTDNWGNFGDQSESTVYVLRPNGTDLEQISSISGLGKGEQIYSVRFIDDVGYVVTFRQVDPLYVLDLSDPANPVLDGELKIPGYSAYLHPVGDGLLLGVGQDATDEGRTTGTQLSLFDVSDPANPQRISTLPIGGQSEVEWDHRAFLFWEPDGTIVLPVSPGWSDCGPAVDCLAKGISGAGGGAVVAELDGRELTARGTISHSEPEPAGLLEPAATFHRDRRRTRHRRPRPDEVQRSSNPRSPRLGVVGRPRAVRLRLVHRRLTYEWCLAPFVRQGGAHRAAGVGSELVHVEVGRRVLDRAVRVAAVRQADRHQPLTVERELLEERLLACPQLITTELSVCWVLPSVAPPGAPLRNSHSIVAVAGADARVDRVGDGPRRSARSRLVVEHRQARCR